MSNPSNTPFTGLGFAVGGRADRMSPAFVAMVNTADPAALTDLNVTFLSVDATGRLRVVLSGPSPGNIISVQPSQLANSPGSAARAVAPGAGAAIATIASASLPAGTYDVQVVAGFDAGAPVAADINNMEFRRGATVVSSLQVFAVINAYSAVRVFRCVLDGSTAVSVNATAAGSAGVGYNAQLVATRIA